MIDFTAWSHPVLAVACPSCARRAGVMCRRPSGHKAADFHARRKAEGIVISLIGMALTPASSVPGTVGGSTHEAGSSKARRSERWRRFATLRTACCPRIGQAEDIGAQVRSDVVLIAHERFQIETRGVVERLPGPLPQERIGRHALGVPQRQLLEHRLFCRCQHAIDPTQHREREDHLAIVRLLVVTPQQIGDTPEEGGQGLLVQGTAPEIFVPVEQARCTVATGSGVFRVGMVGLASAFLARQCSLSRC